MKQFKVPKGSPSAESFAMSKISRTIQITLYEDIARVSAVFLVDILLLFRNME
jgi:hypothetical protein